MSRPQRRLGNLDSTPAPTTRSAQARSSPPIDDSRAIDDQDPLDHLPPLDLPAEVTTPGSPPVSAPPFDGGAKPGADPKAASASQRERAQAASESTPSTPPAPAAEPEPAASASLGIARFASVDSKLAGGSAPSVVGLAWLAVKGYRTLLDLLDVADVPPSFIADATSRGFRYLSLPIGLNTLDREHVTRFNFEIAAAEARPLYFFDADGSRAGALWCIRRIIVDRVDPQIARQEGLELGLADGTPWRAATAAYVADQGTARPTGSDPAPTSPQTHQVNARDRASLPAPRPEQ
jgi:hypothetical protein